MGAEGIVSIVNTSTNTFVDMVSRFFNGGFFVTIANVFNLIYRAMPVPILVLLGFYVLVMSLRFSLRLVQFVAELLPF